GVLLEYLEVLLDRRVDLPLGDVLLGDLDDLLAGAHRIPPEVRSAAGCGGGEAKAPAGAAGAEVRQEPSSQVAGRGRRRESLPGAAAGSEVIAGRFRPHPGDALVRRRARPAAPRSPVRWAAPRAARGCGRPCPGGSA